MRNVVTSWFQTDDDGKVIGIQGIMNADSSWTCNCHPHKSYEDMIEAHPLPQGPTGHSPSIKEEPNVQ